MESRNVKVIDEHGIDRDANIICGFIVEGTKYVLYSIERDEESDNLFVSKVRDNLDKTSNMENIEVGKDKINEIVRELVTYSIKNENDKTTGNISLPNGENIEITNVLFNKEQNIVVPKTYVSTVKKSVTKVSEKFYKIDKQEEALEKTKIFETLPSEQIVRDATSVQSEVVMPEINEVKEEPLPEVSKSEQVQEEPITLSEPTVNPVPVVTEEVKEPEIQPTLETIASVPAPEPKPEISIPSLVAQPVEKVEEVKPQPELEVPQTLLEPAIPPVATLAPLEPEKKEEVKVAPEPVLPVEPIVQTTVVPNEPIKVEAPVVEEPKLLFDGTNENNLNKALNEVSEEKVVSAPQEGVESLREFGVDQPAVAPVQEVPVAEDVKKLTRSKGFANNKFFMVIAIAFFLAACVFLGYEAFQYFTLK